VADALKKSGQWQHTGTPMETPAKTP